MSTKIEMLILNTPMTLVLILLVILLIFCFLQHYIYNSQPIMYSDDDIKYKNKLSNRNQMVQRDQMVQSNEINTKITKINDLKNLAIKKHTIVLINLIKDTKENMQANMQTNMQENKQEKFKDIPVEDIQANFDLLSELQTKIVDFEITDKVDIRNTMNLIRSQRIENKEKIENLLSNLYVLYTLDNINKENIVAYREFVKYEKPEENYFYNQFL